MSGCTACQGCPGQGVHGQGLFGQGQFGQGQGGQGLTGQDQAEVIGEQVGQATMYSETILFHVMPLQNDRSLSKPHKWVSVLIFLLHMLPKVWLQTAQDIFFRAFTLFLFPHHAPTK